MCHVSETLLAKHVSEEGLVTHVLVGKTLLPAGVTHVHGPLGEIYSDYFMINDC